MKHSIITGFVLLALNFLHLHAAETHYSSRVWEVDDGLPHNSVQAIVQTRDGYLWIGTHNGLARFDGVRFTVFNEKNTPGMKSSSISALCESPDGSLWIGTLNAGLIRLHDKDFTFFSKKDGLTDDSIRALFSSRDGSVWLGTTNGISRLQNGRFENLPTLAGLTNHIVRGFYEHDEQGLLIATDSGMYQWKNSLLSPYQTETKEFPRAARAVFGDKAKNIWIGSSSGLSCFRNGGEFIRYDRFQEGLPDSFVICLAQDLSGTLWVGTYDGLGRLEGDRFVTEVNNAGETYGQVNVLLPDREGNLWVGTKDGLWRLRTKPFHTYTKQNGLPNNNVTSVIEASDGTMWFGTWGGGFAQWERGTNTISGYAAIHAGHTHYGVAFDQSLAICEAKDGGLWFGTDFSAGLFLWKDGVLRRFAQAEELNDPAIRVILEDSHGNLWLGTRTALVLFKDGKFTRFTTSEGLAGQTVRSLCEDHDGTLWIGTSGGLSQMRDGKISSHILKTGAANNTVMALHEDRDKTLWIGTAGGLDRFDLSKRVITTFTSKYGLFSDEIFEILEDDAGSLWMSSPKGIFRISRDNITELKNGTTATFRCTAYDKAEGLASIQCNGVAKPAGWKAKDGRLWFATTKGVTVVDPAATTPGNDAPSPVVIEEVRADRKTIENRGWKVENGNGAAPFSTFHPPSSLLVPPGRGELEFHYTVLSFSAPEKNRFKYKLEGIDPDWVDAGTRRTAYYNSIQPGVYTFHVIACNNDGVWSSSGANVQLTLQPNYWQTKWFYGLMGVAAVVLVASIARYATWQRVRLQLRRLEQQHAVEKERARIAQDLHDDMGARLTEIMFLSGAAENDSNEGKSIREPVRKIANASRDCVQNLDAIVWAVNPNNDSIDNLAVYLQDYVERFLRSTNVRCSIDIPSTLPAVVLSSTVRHNVFLVIKEALNNAVTHANCSEINFQFSVDSSTLRIVIADNGKGFNPDKVAGLGNGLKNMQKRIKTTGGKFNLSSHANQGTRVELLVPLSP